MSYEIVVSGSVVTIVKTKEDAERELERIKHSFYAMVHPIDCMYIRKKVEKNA